MIRFAFLQYVAVLCGTAPLPGVTGAESKAVHVQISPSLTAAAYAAASGSGTKFSVLVANTSLADSTIEFSSARRLRVTITDTNNVLVAAIPVGIFGQAFTQDTIPAGGSRIYEATWDGGASGAFFASIQLLTNPVVTFSKIPFSIA